MVYPKPTRDASTPNRRRISVPAVCRSRWGVPSTAQLAPLPPSSTRWWSAIGLACPGRDFAGSLAIAAGPETPGRMHDRLLDGSWRRRTDRRVRSGRLRSVPGLRAAMRAASIARAWCRAAASPRSRTAGSNSSRRRGPSSGARFPLRAWGPMKMIRSLAVVLATCAIRGRTARRRRSGPRRTAAGCRPRPAAAGEPLESHHIGHDVGQVGQRGVDRRIIDRPDRLCLAGIGAALAQSPSTSDQRWYTSARISCSATPQRNIRRMRPTCWLIVRTGQLGVDHLCANRLEGERAELRGRRVAVELADEPQRGPNAVLLAGRPTILDVVRPRRAASSGRPRRR